MRPRRALVRYLDARIEINATIGCPLRVEPGLPTYSNYAELSILDYRKSRALGNGLGIVSGSV
jgi:hypothetical protein